jgi:DNA-binding NtrC family response regulator
MQMTSNTQRILVVEDNRTLREEVRELLEDAGYRVRGARNVKKAAHRLRNHKFDLVLTDYDLGDATGFDVLEVANLQHPDAKLVVMSADINPELSDQAVKSGAARFLEKPFRAKTLLETVSDLLAEVDKADNVDQVEEATTTPED